MISRSIVTIEDVRIIVMGIPIHANPGYGLSTICLLPFNGGWLLFDVGHYGNRRILLNNLKNLKVSPGDINCIVLSHLHWDHCLNVSLFPNATIILSEKELKYAQDVVSGRQVDVAIPKEMIEYLSKHYKIRTFCDNVELNSKINIFETPGHTPGSIVLKIKENKNVILCGDAIKNIWEFTQGFSDMICGCSVDDTRKSINKIKACGEIFIPGHDRPFYIKEDKINFIGEIDWSIWADLYPYEKGKMVFRLNNS